MTVPALAPYRAGATSTANGPLSPALFAGPQSRADLKFIPRPGHKAVLLEIDLLAVIGAHEPIPQFRFKLDDFAMQDNGVMFHLLPAHDPAAFLDPFLECREGGVDRPSDVVGCMIETHSVRNVKIRAGHLKMQPHVKAPGGAPRLLGGIQGNAQSQGIGTEFFDGLDTFADDCLYRFRPCDCAT